MVVRSGVTLTSHKWLTPSCPLTLVGTIWSGVAMVYGGTASCLHPPMVSNPDRLHSTLQGPVKRCDGLTLDSRDMTTVTFYKKNYHFNLEVNI